MTLVPARIRPWAVSAAPYAHSPVPPVSKMGLAETQEALNDLANGWGLGNDTLRDEAANSMLTFFGEHGTSDKVNLNHKVTLSDGTVIDFTLIKLVLGGTYRRFLKAMFADYMTLLEEDPPLAYKMAAIWGYDSNYRTIACDFHDMEALTPGQRDYVTLKATGNIARQKLNQLQAPQSEVNQVTAMGAVARSVGPSDRVGFL